MNYSMMLKLFQLLYLHQLVILTKLVIIEFQLIIINLVENHQLMHWIKVIGI